jgi:hypothetical protein
MVVVGGSITGSSVEAVGLSSGGRGRPLTGVLSGSTGANVFSRTRSRSLDAQQPRSHRGCTRHRQLRIGLAVVLLGQRPESCSSRHGRQ